MEEGRQRQIDNLENDLEEGAKTINSFKRRDSKSVVSSKSNEKARDYSSQIPRSYDSFKRLRYAELHSEAQ